MSEAGDGVKDGVPAEEDKEDVPILYKKHHPRHLGTHDGTFHCDEVLAIWMLKQLPEYHVAEITRTRDPEKLEMCEVVVDVGGVFDSNLHRYDHHQRSFDATFNSLLPSKKWTTKLSSAGLVWVYFGERVISHILRTGLDDDITKVLYDKMYENFVEEVDAIDNGIEQSDGKQRYAITTNLSARVKHLNAAWNDPNHDEMAGFEAAMKMVGGEFESRVKYYQEVWWPARELVQKAIKGRKKVYKTGEIISFKQAGCPWKDHLFDLEEKLKVDVPIKYVLFADTEHDTWRNQCVPVEPHTFTNRLPFPEEWRGLRDEELSKATGIPDCVFVHANGFCGGNKTYKGALEMCKKSLELNTSK